ncbi:MAG: YihY/virulence factor BrkB family protein [Pseudomonadales bacterium]|nr:YihY/virulence factor BrkB family protein [Pseudomonadales bacterium]
MAAFTVLYYAVPNYDVPFRHALLGGVLTMLVFQVLLWAFGEVAPSLSFNVIYGAFAAIPAFLSWIYLVWVLVLCGVVFVRTLSLRRDREPTPEPLVVKAARILRLLQQRHVQGRASAPWIWRQRYG